MAKKQDAMDTAGQGADDEINFFQPELPIETETGTGEIEVSAPVKAKGGLQAFSYIPEAEDVTLPYIRLAQGLSVEVTDGAAKPGQWILPDGSLSDHVTGIVMGMRRTRVYRQDDEVACRSDDAMTGIGTPGGDCADCPLALWTKNGDRSVPPGCTLNYQYLLNYQDDEGQEAGVGVVNMSSKSASKVASQVNLNLRIHGPQNFKITLGSQSVTKGSRKYQVPTLTKVTPLTGQLEMKG